MQDSGAQASGLICFDKYIWNKCLFQGGRVYFFLTFLPSGVTHVSTWYCSNVNAHVKSESKCYSNFKVCVKSASNMDGILVFCLLINKF